MIKHKFSMWITMADMYTGIAFWLGKNVLKSDVAVNTISFDSAENIFKIDVTKEEEKDA